jgi:quinoprotein glucose dehydrogenase
MNDAFRLVALNALETWDEPGPREGVWGRWAPLPARAAGIARASIKSHLPDLLKTAQGDVLNKARELDNRFGAEKPVEKLVALVKDEGVAANLRIDYLKTLDSRNGVSGSVVDEACHAALINPASPPALKVAARGILMKRNPAASMTLINEALLTGSVPERQEAVVALSHLRSGDAEKKLLEMGNQLVAGTLDPVIQVEVLESVRHRDEKRSPWRTILTHYDANMDQGADPLAMHRVALQGGDAELGHTLFLNHQAAQCLRCHAVGGQGGIVGPDLKGIASRQNVDYLLESLVVPSAKVVEGYGIVSVTLKDGKTIAGVLQQKTAQNLTLLEGTVVRTIPASDVAEMSPPMSAMPPMAALLTPRELRDVLAYLQSLK